MNASSNNTPRVTVVMPCYNADATIAASIASIQAQTLEQWELIVVDDGSRDGSRHTVSQLSAEDQRIRLFAQHNAGPAVARNRGVAMARGKIVAFLDSDDIWAPDHLERAIAMIDTDTKLGVAFAPCQHMTADGRPTGHFTRSWPKGVAMADILACNPTATCSSLVVRKDVFATAGDMRADMVHAEDQEWLFRVARAGWSIRSHERATVGYRASPHGLSSDVARMYQGWCTFIDHARGLEPTLVARELPTASASMHLYYARRMIRDGTFGLDVLGHIATAIVTAPAHALRQPKTTFGAAGLAIAGAISPKLAIGISTGLRSTRHA